MTLRWDQRSRVSQYVSYWLNPAQQGVPVEYLVIAGGGGGVRTLAQETAVAVVVVVIVHL